MKSLEKKVFESTKWKKSNAYCAKKLNISLNEFLKIKKGLQPTTTTENTATSEETSIKYDLEKGTGQLSFKNDTPLSPDEIVEKFRIDTSRWRLAGYWNKQQPSGKYLISANIRQLADKEVVEDKFMEFLKTYKSGIKSIPNEYKENSWKAPVMLEFSLADAHIDKWGLEGDSIEEHCANYLRILKELVETASKAHNVEQIAFIIGNDFFNTDNWQNGTTEHINIQDINVRWSEAYEYGFEVLVEAITTLKRYCDTLKIILVQGNHAKTKEFYLGHALEVYFKKAKGIEFDRTSHPRKLLVYGNTAIMYHHGNCKIEDLPLLMASEFPVDWGMTKYHRVHTGDKHFYMEKEVKGVVIKQFPSISQTDTWHNEKNYVLNRRVGLVVVHDRVKGRIAEYEESV